jgi:superfamily II DNA or RNA helicase
LKFLPFKEARNFVHTLRLKGKTGWTDYIKSGNKPTDIPSNPDNYYKGQWQSWGDWFGTGTIAPKDRVYRRFEDSRIYVHSLGLRSISEWRKYCKSGGKPEDIPANPSNGYKKEWKDWGDWLGTGRIANQKKIYRPFVEARKFVQSLELKSAKRDWTAYCTSGQKPIDIPSGPDDVYKKEWKGWGDWIGTGYISSHKRTYRSFQEARQHTQSLGLNSENEWKQYCRSGKKPSDIPNAPSAVYKSKWKGMGDWLGTGFVALSRRKYRPFQEARQFVHSLGLMNRDSWIEFCEGKNKPSDIPNKPNHVYGSEWNGWIDWLGYEETAWSVRRVKELLRSVIDNKLIYDWADDEAALYSILHANGLLNLYSNRHHEFFNNLIGAVQTKEGLKAIEDYTNSDSEIPPDLSTFSNIQGNEDLEEQELDTASTQELNALINKQNKEDPLEYDNIRTPEEILASTNSIESVSVDEETMEFLISRSIQKLWKSVFRNTEEQNNRFVSKIQKNGNKYHDTVVDIFLSDYNGAHMIERKLPNHYSFEHRPKLMQLYVAHKVNTNNYYGNFSGTGAGKTLSAVLASRVIDSMMTVIVCPNDIVYQWKDEIQKIFPDSIVVTGKPAFHVKYDNSKHQYLILNYDKFSQSYSQNLISILIKERIDFVILDEIHYAKKRGEDKDASMRHRNLEAMISAIRNRNQEEGTKPVKVLGLSATPVINHLSEGKSLIEIITGKRYDDLSTNPTIPNANSLYQKLSTISIREMPRYNIKTNTEHVEVIAEKPKEINIKELKRNPLSIEQFLTNARIPEIIKRIQGQTIIYTEYVTEIIPKIRKAVADAGYTFTEYTGSFRDLKSFIEKKAQVLIASKPISIGLDGIQRVCNNLIINTLPWTNAQYQQLVGRLIRPGHMKNFINIHVIEANINGLFPYDRLIKWNRIEYKRTLADCAVDGVMPLKNLATPHQAQMEAVKWLERLERGEISTVVRRDLNVKLTAGEITKRVVKYGDFTKLNNKINSENSDTTHQRMLKDPREWEEYHRQYREARKTWTIVPYEEIIKRIAQLSPRLLIGDFGCGEAKILEKFGNKRVYSFDHVAINENVTACDLKSVPLSDKIDIAVFSLSLMGKNWPDYIKEAKRCLHTNGFLFIVETTKSLKGRLSKIKQVIEKQGFDIYNEEERGDFTFIEAREL